MRSASGPFRDDRSERLATHSWRLLTWTMGPPDRVNPAFNTLLHRGVIYLVQHSDQFYPSFRRQWHPSRRPALTGRSHPDALIEDRAVANRGDLRRIISQR